MTYLSSPVTLLEQNLKSGVNLRINKGSQIFSDNVTPGRRLITRSLFLIQTEWVRKVLSDWNLVCLRFFSIYKKRLSLIESVPSVGIQQIK